MKTLRAHGFNQRPRFEQVVGYLERNEPLPLGQPDRKATSFVTSHFYLDDFVQSSATLGPCSTRLCIPRTASALPQRPRTRTCALRGGTKGTAEPALLRTTWRETPRPAPGQQRAGAALHHGPSAQLSAAPGRGRVRAPERAAPSGPGAAASADHRPAQ